MIYTILDITIQSLYIVGLSAKTSPLVQSGDMSHPANMIIGDIIIDRTQRNILRLFMRLLYMSTVAVEGVDGLAELLTHWCWAYVDAYVVLHSYDIAIFLVRISWLSICILPKNPKRAMSQKIEYVRICLRYIDGTIMNIASLDHNLYFFANIWFFSWVHSITFRIKCFCHPEYSGSAIFLTQFL